MKYGLDTLSNSNMFYAMMAYTLGAGPPPVCTSESIWFDFGLFSYIPRGVQKKLVPSFPSWSVHRKWTGSVDWWVKISQNSTFSKGVMLYIVGKEILCRLILSLERGSENQYFGCFMAF